VSAVPSGDRARVSVVVRVDPASAFRIFTEEIDQWWRRGVKYRIAGRRPGVIAIEAGVGGRMFEYFDTPAGQAVVETGRVVAWEPPARLAFEWRTSNFAPDEKTLVEVTFEPQQSGTLVTVTHSGWSRIRGDHPVRHGLDVEEFVRMKALWWGELMTSLRELAAKRGEP
jgi:uncharacterized protein YndB with AHSA1/START domain